MIGFSICAEELFRRWARSWADSPHAGTGTQLLGSLPRGLPVLAACMAIFAAPAVEHKTKFDPEMVPGIAGEKIEFPLSNGRQIVRTASGQWLVGFDVPGKGLFATVGPPGRTEGSRFSEPVLLVGDGKPGLLGQAVQPRGLSFAASGQTLHIAWSDRGGVWLASTEIANLINRRSPGSARPELIAPGGVFGDITAGPQGGPLVAYSSTSGIFVKGKTGPPERASPDGMEPVIEFDRRGGLHLAFRLEQTIPFAGQPVIDPRIAYVSRTERGWGTPRIVAHGISSFPSLGLSADRPVIAFQFEGVHKVQRAARNLIEQREGGGSGIGFAAPENGAWLTGFISQAREIVTRDDSTADAFKGRIYPMVEEKWRPKIAIDKYGIPWAFWPDTTRRHTYFARWMGTRFSDAFECRGAYYAPSEYLAVEKRMPLSASEIGFAYVAAGRLFFGTMPVPSASTGDDRRILFLDMLEVSNMQGLTRELGRFNKYRDNPVFSAGAAGAWDDFGVSFPNVRQNQARFTMEYTGRSRAPGPTWNHGLAESADGIRWTRPNLKVSEYNGSRDNNLIPWIPNFRDPKDPDPRRRYKGVLVEGNWITNFRRPLATSPDAIHWKIGEDTVNLTSLFEGGGPAFRDDLEIPERRFKAVGRTISQGHRALGIMWSADLVHWYGEEAVLDIEDPYGKPAQQWRGRYGAVRILDPAGEMGGDQIYWGNVWIENGIYMCLYAPMQYDGGYQASLAMSRDGFNFVRIRNGEFILPRGPAGAWDSGMIAVGYGVNIPVKVNGGIRIYYGGSPWHHGTDPWRVPPAIGMAEIRADGWTFITPSAGHAAGTLISIPIGVDRIRARKLMLNAVISEGDGKIQVEVLPEEGVAPLPGFALADCKPLTRDSTRWQVSWAGGAAMPTGGPRIRLRFQLSGVSTKLHSFWFE